MDLRRASVDFIERGGEVKRRYQNEGLTLRATRELINSNAALLRELRNNPAKKQLDAAGDAFDVAAVEQRVLERDRRGAVRRRMQLERLLLMKYLTPLGKLARSCCKERPELAGLTQSVQEHTREKLVRSARSMASFAEAKASVLFRSVRFPATFFPELRALASEVEATCKAVDEMSVTRIGATKAIEMSTRDGRRAIAELDASIEYHFGDDARLMREWRAAKRVPRRRK